ncbi:PREDICTED: transcription elongation factor SPT5-like [Vollenhovia emeryi]|uniref:transcription elongation factor SPT5-like n=1 Tax=Vollenhovia emeryi TaxID=411798 RepID=UPI0005F515F3|nr:PREDICTED: transcription elongation factor SPT5-like [Vollenhovia emeryi]
MSDSEGRPRKKEKKDRFGGFIIDEAEVDYEVEDDDEWEEGAQEIGIVGNEVDELGPTAREIEGRRRGTNLWDSHKEDEIEEYLRKKYADESIAARRFGDGGEEISDEITRLTLLPSVKDPYLWMVKCRIGEEKATVLLLMRKFITYQFSNEPLQIKSVVAPEGVKGYIYIEAYKQPHVKAAIENVGNLRMGIWKQRMVPIKEMTDVLRVETLKRKKKRRPPAKPFDPEAIHSIGGEVTSDGDFLIFEGNRYSRKGFLSRMSVDNGGIASPMHPSGGGFG